MELGAQPVRYFPKRLLVIPSWAVLRHGTGETVVFVRIRSAFRGRINLHVYRQALNSISISRRQRFAAAKEEKLSLFVDELRASPREMGRPIVFA